MKCNCGKEVGKYTILQLCDDCYHARKLVYGKKYRALNTTKAIPQWQSRGVHSCEWMVCCRTDCKRKFRRLPWQSERWTMCPRHKAIADGMGRNIAWLRTQGK